MILKVVFFYGDPTNPSLRKMPDGTTVDLTEVPHIVAISPGSLAEKEIEILRKMICDFMSDITRQKEEAIRSIEKRYNELVDQSSFPIETATIKEVPKA